MKEYLSPHKWRYLIRMDLFKTLFLIMATGLTLLSARSAAQGNLLLTPQRVVFEGSKKIEELNLANIGKDTARFVISLINLRMREDGSFDEITQPDTGQNFADKWVRFFPHSVILGPQESQAIRIQLLHPNAMEPGEYRSHIYFRAIPNEEPLGEKDSTIDSSISVRLTPVFGISIPVIIRIGPNTTQATLANLALQWGKEPTPVMDITFHRDGSMSVYGDVFVDYISPQGKTTRVATVKGLAVYTPIPLRHFSLALEDRPGVNYHSGHLHITYAAPGQHKATIAEGELILH